MEKMVDSNVEFLSTEAEGIITVGYTFIFSECKYCIKCVILKNMMPLRKMLITDDLCLYHTLEYFASRFVFCLYSLECLVHVGIFLLSIGISVQPDNFVVCFLLIRSKNMNWNL